MNAPLRVPISRATEPVVSCGEVAFLDLGIGALPREGLLDCLQRLAQFLHLDAQEIKMQVALRLIALNFQSRLKIAINSFLCVTAKS